MIINKKVNYDLLPNNIKKSIFKIDKLMTHKKWILKRYEKSPYHFYFDKRIKLIEKNGPSFNLPTYIVRHLYGVIEIYQPFVFHRRLNVNDLSTTMFKEFLFFLEGLHNIGLIHGDLSYSNIGVSENGIFYIFDWEPFLWENKDGVKFCRSTPYCLSPTDQINKIYTVLSDRFAITSILLIVYIGISMAYIISNNKNIKIAIDIFVNKNVNLSLCQFCSLIEYSFIDQIRKLL